MTKLNRIQKLEADIALKQRELAAIRQEPSPSVKHGDYVIILRDYEWVCDRGTRMYVDSVADGRIYCRNANPKYRNNGIYWISNGDWVKEE